jgi:hypothetical protein
MSSILTDDDPEPGLTPSSQMTLDQKIGQMTQPERMACTPDDVRAFHLGSVLSGGGSCPGDNRPADWVAMNDAYWRASMHSDAEHLRFPCSTASMRYTAMPTCAVPPCSHTTSALAPPTNRSSSAASPRPRAGRFSPPALTGPSPHAGGGAR